MHITTTQFNYSADLNFQMNESHFVDFRHAVAEVWAWVLHLKKLNQTSIIIFPFWIDTEGTMTYDFYFLKNFEMIR